MEASESSKSHRKWYSEEGSNKGRSCGQEISEKRKHLSGDEDGYQGRKEMHSKQIRNSPDKRPEKISSSGYQDRELECSQKSRDDTGAEGKEVADDGQRESLRNSSSETSGHECFQRKIRSKIDDSYDGETEKMKDRNSRYPERKESFRDEAHKSHEPDWSPREWDESGSAWKREGNDYMGRNDLGSGKVSDMQDESSKERTDPRNGLSETKSRAVDLKFDKAFKSTYDEEKRVYQGRNKNRGRYEVQEKESRNSSIIREEKLGNPRDDKQRMSQEKPIAFIEDLYSNDRGITRGHGDNEDEDSRRPWSPERSVRLRQQSESELNYGKIISFKEKDLEKEVYRNERSKVRDNSWSDRNKDPEGSKDIWNRRQNNDNFREVAYGEFGFSQEKGWESQRQGHERIDNDELNNRPGYRKANWVEGGKTNYESSDSIEIQFQFQKHNFISTISDEHCVYPSEDRSKVYSTCPREDIQEKYSDDGSPLPENIQIQAEMGRGQGSIATFSRGGGPSPISASQTPFGNYQGLGGFGRGPPEGAKANRFGRAGSGRMSGRKGQRMSIPMPTMGPPSGSLALPHGPMRPLGPNMSPASPPIGVCIPQFTGPNGWPGTQGIDMNVLAMLNVWPGAQGVDMKVLAMPNVWPGAQGVDMNVLAIPPGFFPFLSGPSPSGFLPNMGNDPNAAMYFSQLGHARGVSSNMSGPVFNSRGTMGRGISHDKAPGGWAHPKNSDHPGKAPSRGERNDYSQNFVDTGLRPQNFIRELDLTCVVEDYPKLGELIQKKDEIVAKSVFPPMYYKCDLREFPLSPEFFGTKFDAILVDPPWEEYVHRAPGVADNREYWTFEDIMNLKIEAIADTPSFIFLWVGDGIGRHQGRQCLKKWGFRRCEDICWVKTNKSNATPGLQHDAQTLFQHSKEHCLMGIKGTVRRGPDGHIIHANIDTDVIVAEEPPYGSTKKPEDIYRIIEHFSLGRRRLELFGGDRNIRSGWLTLGKGLSSSNFNAEGYTKNFADKDGKVWQGGGGRIPPPGAPHLVVTTPDIEGLRPKSPLPKHQQPPPSAPTNSINRKSTGSSLQDQTIICVNQDVTRSTTTTFAHRTCPPEILALPSGDGYNTSAWT